MPKKKVVLFSKRAAVSHYHRRRKVNTKRLVLYIIEYFGDQLYYLGATIEREIKNTLRSFRRGTKRGVAAVGRFLKFIFGTLGRWLLTVLRDIVNPFLKLFRSMASLSVVMRQTRKMGFRAGVRRFLFFFKYGWMWNKHLVTRCINQVIPVLAAAVFGFVLYGMLGLNFALAVTYNDQIVGYVVNERIFDSAQRIIRGRMLEAEGGGWAADVKLSLAVVSKEHLVSQSGMADNLLRVSGTGVSEAYGLYIADMFYGATTDGVTLEQSLERVLLAYRLRNASEDVKDVVFALPVELREGVYPSSSVREIEELDDFVHSTRQPAVYHIIEEEQSLEEVSLSYGVTAEMLLALNPDKDLLNLMPGDALMIADETPSIPVKVVRTEIVVEEISVEEEIIYDSRYERSFSHVFYAGEPGFKEVVYETEYVNGVMTAKTATEEKILKDMIKRTIVNGAKIPVGLGGRPPVTGGILGWPTGAFQHISRGSGPGGHPSAAIDIACVFGTNVYAAESGTVVQSVYSDYGYGYYIEIDHGMVDGENLRTLYAHHSENLVEVGQRVERGQVIAYAGSTGNSSGNHLHFEVRINGERVPPEPWLGIEVVGD